MNHIIKGIIGFCLGLLYPKRCVVCDKVLSKLEKEVGICKKCSKSVKLIGSDYCMKCGVPMRDKSQVYCINCKDGAHVFDQSKAVFRYTGNMKNSMYRFKYANRRNYARCYAKFAVKQYGQWIRAKNIEAIIPVPMYEKKKRKRGYNQAEVFARALSELTRIPTMDKIVRRDVNTTAMKQLNRVKRKKNLLKAFILEENVVQFRKVLIVDDIYTTGTTIDEVAKVLKAGGVDEVYGLCVCIGEMQ